MKRIRYRVDFAGHEWYFSDNERDKVKSSVQDLRGKAPELFKITEYLSEDGKVAITKTKKVKEEEL